MRIDGGHTDDAGICRRIKRRGRRAVIAHCRDDEMAGAQRASLSLARSAFRAHEAHVDDIDLLCGQPAERCSTIASTAPPVGDPR